MSEPGTSAVNANQSAGAAAPWRLPSTIAEETNRFEREVARYLAGEISHAEFRAVRVPRGMYEQRQDGAYMLRVRLPGGVLTSAAIATLVAVTRAHGGGRLHLTTRQDIQIHNVAAEHLVPAARQLHAAGLSTWGGGGNTLRNITACPSAGICAAENFDVTPHVIAVTERLLESETSYRLPRKFKIGFTGCTSDCAAVRLNDLGFSARFREGEPGYAVFVGGGMGPHTRIGDLLEEFVPCRDILMVAEAVKRIFDRHGNRRNKHKARLRFLVEALGIGRFTELYHATMAEIRAEGIAEVAPPSTVKHRPAPPPSESPGPASATTFRDWSARHVVAQKQAGLSMVRITIPLGDIDVDRFERLGAAIALFGDRAVRVTQDQNLVLRGVTTEELPVLRDALGEIGLAQGDGMISRRMIACAGTATCRLGLCLSQNLLGAVDGEIRHRELDQAADIRIHISGCPNSCGRHPIADIGLFGAVRRLKDRLVPSYVLQLGGRGGEKTTRLAEGCEMIPARAVPALVGDLIEAFRDSGAPSFGDWILDAGKTVAEELAEKYRSVPSFEEAPEHYHDWGANELFSLAGRGPGECSAGVFDLIELDLANAATALHEDKLGQAIDYATRALLITQGVEARDPSESRSLFIKHFIDAGLAPERFKAVVAAAATPDRDAIADLIVGVRKLYDSMDDSLRFKPVDATKSNVESSTPREAEISPAPRGLDPSPASCGVDTSPAAIAALEGKKPPAAASATAERSATPTSIASPASSPDPASTSGDLPAPDREMDLRGVTCPLNYVRTKMTLAGMKRGEILAVLLDEQGARNVPQSAEGDGHAVLGIIAIESHWRVLLRKDG